jgi:hypothetical protein
MSGYGSMSMHWHLSSNTNQGSLGCLGLGRVTAVLPVSLHKALMPNASAAVYLSTLRGYVCLQVRIQEFINLV